MTIKITDEDEEIRMTRAEYDQYRRDWEASQSMTTAPVDFKTWLRRKKAIANVLEVRDASEKCKSCSDVFRLPATHYGHPVDEHGKVIPELDNWPLCVRHVMSGVLAGWNPTPIPKQSSASKETEGV